MTKHLFRALSQEQHTLSTDGVTSLISVTDEAFACLLTLSQSPQIGPEGARLLSSSLMTNVSLTKLNLKNNQLGAEGAQELAPMIAGNRYISTRKHHTQKR